MKAFAVHGHDKCVSTAPNNITICFLNPNPTSSHGEGLAFLSEAWEKDIWRSGKSHFCDIRIFMHQCYPPTLEINSKSSVTVSRALCPIPIPQGCLGITVCLLVVSEMKHKCWDLDYWLFWLVIPIIVTLFTNIYGDVSILWQLVWLDASLMIDLYKLWGLWKTFQGVLKVGSSQWNNDQIFSFHEFSFVNWLAG